MKNIKNIKNNRKLAGSFTVEASFVVPILLGIILALLQIGLTLHDRIAAEALLNDALFFVCEGLEGKKDGKIDFAALSKARLFFCDESGILSEGENRLRENASKTLLISDFAELKIEKGLTEINGQALLKTKSIIPGGGLFSSKIGTVSYDVSRPLFDKEEKTRLISVIFEELVRYGVIDD